MTHKFDDLVRQLSHVASEVQKDLDATRQKAVPALLDHLNNESYRDAKRNLRT